MSIKSCSISLLDDDLFCQEACGDLLHMVNRAKSKFSFNKVAEVMTLLNEVS